MNKVIYKYNENTTLTFTDLDEGVNDGRIIEGSFYNETSLLEDELSIDTMTVHIRYERESPSLISFTYGSEVEYYKDNTLYAKYFSIKLEEKLFSFSVLVLTIFCAIIYQKFRDSVFPLAQGIIEEIKNCFSFMTFDLLLIFSIDDNL